MRSGRRTPVVFSKSRLLPSVGGTLPLVTKHGAPLLAARCWGRGLRGGTARGRPTGQSLPAGPQPTARLLPCHSDGVGATQAFSDPPACSSEVLSRREMSLFQRPLPLGSNSPSATLRTLYLKLVRTRAMKTWF